MLDGLDAVDWSSVTHAYGEATDVPGFLRALISPDPETRGEAVFDLWNTINHQGTVYPASATAVPFLYELLTAPEVQDKSAIADLIAGIANGVGYLEVHAVSDTDQRVYRKMMSEQGKTLEGELAREAAETEAVRRAASAGLRHLLPYLHDTNPLIRSSVAIAVGNYLGNYPEHEAWSVPAIDAALATETDDRVRKWVEACKTRRTNR